jgi:hypothetical protein
LDLILLYSIVFFIKYGQFMPKDATFD